MTLCQAVLSNPTLHRGKCCQCHSGLWARHTVLLWLQVPDMMTEAGLALQRVKLEPEVTAGAHGRQRSDQVSSPFNLFQSTTSAAKATVSGLAAALIALQLIKHQRVLTFALLCCHWMLRTNLCCRQRQRSPSSAGRQSTCLARSYRSAACNSCLAPAAGFASCQEQLRGSNTRARCNSGCRRRTARSQVSSKGRGACEESAGRECGHSQSKAGSRAATSRS